MLAKQEEKALACLLNILTGGRYIYKKLRRRSIVTDRAAASSYGAQGFASFSAAELAAAVPCPSVYGGVGGWGGERVSLGAESIREEYFVLKMHRSARIDA